ncbi:hypothetical protein QQS21_010355 [Conoideocrella luteorostrata]|uniref:Uncharacterized protein n=1 Tax=Conoideocrella luteorostrata TaxID=1105319 RepID=A0AAJ0CJM7_9HYPO|nr:hypothetical protein QQS21_010355 [Conoideocrella luteorostrata]
MSGQMEVQRGDIQSLIDSKIVKEVDPQLAWDHGTYGHCPEALEPANQKAPTPSRSKKETESHWYDFLIHHKPGQMIHRQLRVNAKYYSACPDLKKHA